MQRFLPAQGTRWMLAAALSFALMAACAKILHRIPTFDKVLWRSVFSVVVTLWALRRAGRVNVRRRPRRQVLLLLRGVLGFCGLTGYFLAIEHLPLGNAVVIQNTNPLFAGLFAAVFLGEVFRPGQIAAIGVCLAGVVLVAQPSAEAPLLGSAFALGSAIFAGAAYATVRGLHRSEHPLVIVLVFPLVSIPLALALGWNDLTWPRGTEWLWLLALGVTTQAGQVCLTQGLRLQTAARAMHVAMVGVIFAMLIGALVWDEVPGLLPLAGTVLILLSLVAYRPPAGPSITSSGPTLRSAAREG